MFEMDFVQNFVSKILPFLVKSSRNIVLFFSEKIFYFHQVFSSILDKK